jgi:hypothetical protein
MMDILCENSKKEYPKSVTELLRLEEKRFLQVVCYFINKIPKFIYKIKRIVRNIFLGVKVRPARKADNFTAFCKPTV